MPAPRYSPSAEADAVYAAWIDAARAFLLSVDPAPAAVLLQGSAARGEAWAVRGDAGHLTLLSDLDLAVVCVHESDRAAWLSARERFAAAMAAAPDAARAPGPWTFAVYAPSDLPRQLPKMGTIDLAHARVLAGDPSYVERVAPREPSAINIAEALRLVAVRLHEFDAVVDAGAPALHTGALAAKVLADAGTALVSACGVYAVSAAVRRDTLDRLWGRELAPLARTLPELPARLRAAQDVRLREAGERDVAEALSVAPDAAARVVAAACAPWVRAVAAWLAQRATAGAGDPALVARTAAHDAQAFAAAMRAWLAASPRHHAWRAWARAVRSAARQGHGGRVFALARAHRATPEPWRVAAVDTLTAGDATARAAARDVWRLLAEG